MTLIFGSVTTTSGTAFAQTEPGIAGGKHAFALVDVTDWADSGLLIDDWTLDSIVEVAHTRPSAGGLNARLDLVVNLNSDGQQPQTCAFLRRTNTYATATPSTHDATWTKIAGPNGVNVEAFDAVVSASGETIVGGRYWNGQRWVAIIWGMGPGGAITYNTYSPDDSSEIRGVNSKGEWCGVAIDQLDLQPWAVVGDAAPVQLPDNPLWDGHGANAISEWDSFNELPWIAGVCRAPLMGGGYEERLTVWYGAVSYHVFATGAGYTPTAITRDGHVCGFKVETSGARTAALWVRTNADTDPTLQTPVWEGPFTFVDGDYGDAVPLDMNNAVEMALQSAWTDASQVDRLDTGGLWAFQEDAYADPDASDLYFCPVHYHVNGLYEIDYTTADASRVDGLFGPEAIDDHGVIAGRATVDGVDRVFIVWPHDTNNNGVSDVREIVQSAGAGDADDDWVLDYAQATRPGIYGIGNAGTGINYLHQFERNQISRIHTSSNEIRGTLDNAQTRLINVINTMGYDANGPKGEMIVRVRFPESRTAVLGTPEGDAPDAIPTSIHREGDLDDLRAFFFSAALFRSTLGSAVDYAEMGNEPYSAQSPGHMIFRAGELPADPTTAHTYATLMQNFPSTRDAYFDAIAIHHGWLASAAQAVREGSCMTGRPLRIITPSPVIAIMWKAAGLASFDPDGQDPLPQAFVNRDHFNLGNTWADVCSVHLHPSGEKVTTPPNEIRLDPEYAAATIVRDWLSNQNGTSWLADAEHNALPEQIACTEAGPQSQSAWNLRYQQKLHNFMNCAPLIYERERPDSSSWSAFVYDYWIDLDDGVPHLRPDTSASSHLDAGFDDVLTAVEDRGFLFVCYGNAMGGFGGVDCGYTFDISPLQAVGVLLSGYPGTPPYEPFDETELPARWNTEIIERWDNYAPNDLENFDPKHCELPQALPNHP